MTEPGYAARVERAAELLRMPASLLAAILAEAGVTEPVLPHLAPEDFESVLAEARERGAAPPLTGYLMRAAYAQLTHGLTPPSARPRGSSAPGVADAPAGVAPALSPVLGPSGRSMPASSPARGARKIAGSVAIVAAALVAVGGGAWIAAGVGERADGVGVAPVSASSTSPAAPTGGPPGAPAPSPRPEAPGAPAASATDVTSAAVLVTPVALAAVLVTPVALATPTALTASSPLSAPDPLVPAPATRVADVIVEPGEGLRGVRVGVSTPEDVLRAFGHEGHIGRAATSGEALSITYAFTQEGVTKTAGWVGEATTPSFLFSEGVLDTISFGREEAALVVRGGVRVGDSRESVRRALGEGAWLERIRTETFSSDILDYEMLGVQLYLAPDGPTVTSIAIVPRVPPGSAVHGVPEEDRLLIPGKGVRGIVVGRSTVADVLRTFGEDCRRREHDGEVTGLDYSMTRSDGFRFRGRRVTPDNCDFASGRLESIRVSGARALETPGGISVGATIDDVKREFGDAPDTRTLSSTVELRYDDAGILFWIDGRDLLVRSIGLFEPARVRLERLREDADVVAPGRGVRGLAVGVSSEADILRAFGTECFREARSKDRLSLDYTMSPDGRYKRGTPRFAPIFRLEKGVLDGVQMLDDGFRTSRGVLVGSPEEDVVAEFGRPEESGDRYMRYPSKGIEFELRKAPDEAPCVSGISIDAPVRARRR